MLASDSKKTKTNLNILPRLEETSSIRRSIGVAFVFSGFFLHQSKLLEIKFTMHFNVLAILDLASIASASAITEVDSSLSETSSSLEILSKYASYNCKGNPMCVSTTNSRS